MFTNVANSPAKQTCLKPVATSLNRNKNIIGAVTIIFALYVFACQVLC